MSFSFNRVKSFHNLSTNMKYSVRLRSTKPNVETKTLYPQINAEIRILSGSKKSRELRKLNLIPGNLYGKDKNDRAFSQIINSHKKEISREIRLRQDALENVVYQLVIPELPEPILVTMRQIQINSTNGDPIAVNFMVYRPGNVLSIPIRFENEELNEDIKKGKSLVPVMDFIKCVCEDKVPEYFPIDITLTPTGGIFRVEHIVLPPGVNFVTKDLNSLLRKPLAVIKLPRGG